MTVENWLRGHFEEGDQIKMNTLLLAAISPAEAEPNPLRAVSLSDEYEDYIGDKEYKRSTLYALSTLYYAMSGYTGGGTRSEKRGNRQVSIGGKAIDVATREAWRREGDRLRKLLGCEIEESATESGGAFDATNLRQRPRY